MAQDPYGTPAYGIPNRFKTPEQRHADRLRKVSGGIQSRGGEPSWIGAGLARSLFASMGSSFVSGFASDAKTLDYVFDADILKDTDKALSEIAANIDRWKPKAVAELEGKQFIKDTGEFGDAWGDLYSYTELAGSGLGSIAAMILGGGIFKQVAKGGLKAYTTRTIRKRADEIVKKGKGIKDAEALRMARNQVTDLATKYDAALGVGAYGTAEMAMVSGSVGKAIEEEVMRAPAEVLNQSEAFRTIYYDMIDNYGLDHNAAHNMARTKLSREAGIEGAKTIAIPSFMLGSVAGRYVDKAISGRLSTSTLKNFGILEGVEIPTEAAQGGTEQYVQNKVYKDLIDKTRNLYEGVPDAAFREGMGVAFGASPLSVVAAHQAAKQQGTKEALEDNEMALIDQALRINEAEANEALKIQDPLERAEALAGIISRGKPEFKDVDLTQPIGGEEDPFIELTDENLAAYEEEERKRAEEEAGGEIPPEAPVEPVPGDTGPPPETTGGGEVGPTPPAGGVEPPTETPPETPVEPVPPGEPPAEPVTEPPVTPPVEIPPETPPVEEPPVELPPAAEADVPAHKANFEAFRAGKEQGSYTPEPPAAAGAIAAMATATKADTVDVDEILNLPRTELNALGKMLGFKTAKSREKLREAVVFASNLINTPIGEMSSAEENEARAKLNEFLLEPYSTAPGIATALQLADFQMKAEDAAGEFYDRAQHREAIEAAIETGDFTLEDFNALPESDQTAYADIGRKLRSDATPTPTPETPEGGEEGGEEGGGTPPAEPPTEPVGPKPPPTPPTPPAEEPVPETPVAEGEQPWSSEGGLTGTQQVGEKTGGTRITIPNVRFIDEEDGFDKAVLKFDKEGNLITVRLYEAPPEDGSMPSSITIDPGYVLEPDGKTTHKFNVNEVDRLFKQAKLEQDKTVPGGGEPVDKPVEETPEGETDVEAIRTAFESLAEGDKILLGGTNLSGAPMNDLTVELVKQAEDGWLMGKGKKRFLVKFDAADDKFYVSAFPSTKRSRIITSAAKVVGRTVDEDPGTTGTTLRRPHEMWRNTERPTEAKKYLNQLIAATAKAGYVNSASYSETTPGTKRLYQEYMKKIPSFTDWLEPYIKRGWRDNDISPRAALMKIIEGTPLVEFSADRNMNVQTREDLEAYAEIYMDMMAGIQGLVDGAKTVKELHSAMARHEISNTLRHEGLLETLIPMSEEEYMEWFRDTPRMDRIMDRKPEVDEDTGLSTGAFYATFTGLFPKALTEYHGLHYMHTKHTADENVLESDYGDHPPHVPEKLEDLYEQRTGMPDHRKGKNVSTEELQKTFSFLGVTVGGHVKTSSPAGQITESQLYRNMAYDAYADLAYILGVPLEVVGHNIYLSIGALGHGKGTGAAFFSPNYPAIAMSEDELTSEAIKEILDNNNVMYSESEKIESLRTKLKKVLKNPKSTLDRVRVMHFNRNNGDGSLGHEWMHNFGSNLQLVESATYENLIETVNIEAIHQKVTQLIQQFIESNADADWSDEQLVNQLKDDIERAVEYKYRYTERTRFYKNAKKIDDKKGGNYWSSGVELFARAGEAWLLDTIAADGGFNPFLQSSKSGEGVATAGTGYLGTIYPEGDERQQFRALYQLIFNNVEVQPDGSLDFPNIGDRDWPEFFSHFVFEEIKADYLGRLDEVIAQAIEDRTAWQEAEMEKGDLTGLTDKEIEDLLTEGDEEEEKPITPKPPNDNGPRTGAGGVRNPRPTNAPTEAPPPVDVKAIAETLGVDESDIESIIDIFSAPGTGNIRFSVKTVEERNPSINAQKYEMLVPVLSRIYAKSKERGQGATDAIRGLGQQFKGEQKKQMLPYLLQFLKDMRNGDINYTDYLDTPDTGADEGTEGTDDGGETTPPDDGSDISGTPDDETTEGTGAGAGETGTDGQVPSGGRRGTPLDTAGIEWFKKLTVEEQAQWLYEQKGLRSVTSAPVSGNVSEEAQTPKVPIIDQNENELGYQVPTAMAEYMEQAVRDLELSVLDPENGIHSLVDYVRIELGYDTEAEMREGLMSLQMEAVAASIYQMKERGRSVIIADQTGVGKGRQGGSIIRWVIAQGKVPIFVTADPGLYTDMYYDMVDAGTNNVVPMITNGKEGIKERGSKEGEETYLHYQTDDAAKRNTAHLIKNGTLPKGYNAMFTTYDQMNSEKGGRRDAMRELVANGNAVLILDESHKAAGYKPPSAKRTNQNLNEFFTSMIRAADNTVYMSATFAKRAGNLGFYFNTDLVDAMDGMRELVGALEAGGTQLQEVMSRAITRNGQLFRREISYEGVEIVVDLADPDTANSKRDRDATNKINEIVRKLIPLNAEIVKEVGKTLNGLALLNSTYPSMIAAGIMADNGSISQADYKRIEDAMLAFAQNPDAGPPPNVVITPVGNSIHNLRDMLLTAAKADIAVDEILNDIANGRKPLIGLDKTNMAMIEEFIHTNGKKEGDSMKDLNWASLLEFWVNKSYRATISLGDKEVDKIRGSLGRDTLDLISENTKGEDVEYNNTLDELIAKAKKDLSAIDLPLSPVDYIRQKAEERAKTHPGIMRSINIQEITGRHKGGVGIDYSDPDNPILKRIPPFLKLDVVDGFNGNKRSKGGEVLPSDVDGLVINQSGSTGISMHSSEKFGDQRSRHMTIIEPAGDINVFQQMLGRIFRTGMAVDPDTGEKRLPTYTIVGSAIPADVRKINVLRQNMESLNAQTSSSKEGSAQIDVVDFLNMYGDDVVKLWLAVHPEFGELFGWVDNKIPKSKENHERGLAYWVSGKIGLFSFDAQQEFFDTITEDYIEYVNNLKAAGLYELEQQFFDYKADYREEITLAEPRGDPNDKSFGKGFNAGAWLVRILANIEFNPMSVQEIISAVKPTNVDPIAEKVEAVKQRILDEQDKVLADIAAIELESGTETNDLQMIKRQLNDLYVESAVGINADKVGSNEARLRVLLENIERRKVIVRPLLKKGTQTRFDELVAAANRVGKQAVNKHNFEELTDMLKTGNVYNVELKYGEQDLKMQLTMAEMERVGNSTDPWALSDVATRVVFNAPGPGDARGSWRAALSQVSGWKLTPVHDQDADNTDYETAAIRKEADELIRKSKQKSDQSKDKDKPKVITDDEALAAARKKLIFTGKEEVYKRYQETLAQRANTKDVWVVLGNPLVGQAELEDGVRGQYIQFTDYMGRRMLGIKIPDHIVDTGIENAYKGNAEIPSSDVIMNFFTDNPGGEFSAMRGFQSRSGNVRITSDPHDRGKVRVTFREEGVDKLTTDPKLQNILKALNVHQSHGEDRADITVDFADAREVLGQIMRRTRVIVLNGDKHLLANYMTLPIPQSAVKAGDAIKVQDVSVYTYENGITAHRGVYHTKSTGAKKQGFFVKGLPSGFNLGKITRYTSMKGKSGDTSHDGSDIIGVPFLFEGDFISGKADEVFGEPIAGKSKTKDGTAFSVGRAEKKVTAAQAKRALGEMPFRLQRTIKVVQSESELPEAVRKKILYQDLNGLIKGVFHEGNIYIVADGLDNPHQAMTVYLHEAVGHYGLRKLMGNDLKPLLNQVASLYPADMKRLAKEYNVDISTVEGKHEIAEEVLAHIAEKGTNLTIMNRLVALFRKLMRQLGFPLTLSAVDVSNILASARQVVESGGFDAIYPSQQGNTLFSIQSNTATAESSVPEDTVMDGIRDGQPVDAVFRALWRVAETTQVPKLIRLTSSATLRGALNFYDNNMKWAHPAMQHMAKGLIDQYGLSKEFKLLKASVASKKAMLIDEVRDIIAVMESLGVTDADAKNIHEILTNEAPRDEAWDSVTEPIRKRVEVLGQEAVGYGLISQESYDRNKGMYLHRVYQQYEQNRSGLQKWADSITGKRHRISGEETMERGKSLFLKPDKLKEDLGLEEIEDGMTIYQIRQMSANGQKSLRTYYSLSPLDQEGYTSEEFVVRGQGKGRVKLWRDFTKTEREEMGEIVDARYTVGKTFALLAHDLANGEFFSKIAENEAWTMPKAEEKQAQLDGLIMDAQAATQRGGVVTGAEWVRVPATGIKKSQAKVYGALAGRVVRAEIYQDLNQVNQMQQASIWKTIMTTFKLNKTARNPVVHFNNIMSNMVLMDMADVRFSDLYQAIKEMRAKGDIFKEAKANGTFGASYAEMELKNEVLDKLIDEIHLATDTKPVGLEEMMLSMEKLPFNKQFAFMMKLLDGLWQGVDIKGRKVGLRALDQKMLNYYQHEDEVFRMATYIRRRNQGMDAIEAGMSARDQFLNYDISAPWINAAKATVLPFISYTYRAVPIVAKSIMQRPWKMAKYFTIAYGMNALGYALSGGDEDRERKSLRDEVSGHTWIGAPRLIRMGWNDKRNNPTFWDVRRLIPVGDVFDREQYHAALPIIPASVMPTGPIAMVFEFTLNKTGFFGEEIVDPLADDWVTGTEKTMDWMWKAYGPSAPWIPYSYYWDKIGIATTGGRDRLGRQYEIMPALASSFGIKMAPHDVKYGMALKAMNIERTVQAIRHRLNFLEKDHWQRKISKAEYMQQKGRYLGSLKRLEEEAKELMR